MKAFEILKSVFVLNKKIDMLIFNEKLVPNELILEHNKLLNDYNEALNFEKSKKDENK